MVTISVAAADLRAAYMPGRRKTGDVRVNGLTYDQKPITRIVFGRYNRVEYWNDHEQFATFQDTVGIDD